MSHIKIYRPLAEGYFIRLLTLKSGITSDPIQVELSVVNLYESPNFEALSYVWGSQNKTARITCDDHPFDVTTNLFSALIRIRHIDRPRILWIDAICINQQDLDERAIHVAFMGKIYARALVVLIFLGHDEDSRGKDVKELVEQVSEMIKVQEQDGKDAMVALNVNDSLLDDSRWKALVSMLQCTWFTRAWVIQEVGLAQDPRILYGDNEFSYRDLIKVAIWQYKYAPQLTARVGLDFSTIHIEWLDWSPGGDEVPVDSDRTFLELMNQASWLGCVDHRDHIYSLLGHPLAQLPNGGGLIVKPDYQSPVPKVYYELASELLKIPGGIRLLSAVENNDQGPPDGSPSWVPLWLESITICTLGLFSGFYYDASKGLDEPVPSLVDKGLLYLKGVDMDCVLETFQFSKEDMKPPQEIALDLNEPKTLQRIWETVMKLSVSCPYEDRNEALSLTLTAGLTGYDPADTPEYLPLHCANFNAYYQQLLALNSANVSRTMGDAEKYWVDMRLVSSGRSFFITEKGRYGLGPGIVRKGDHCTVLSGSRVPFILRRVLDRRPEGKNCWKLVGECYLHGIMKGETTRLIEQDIEHCKEIILC